MVLEHSSKRLVDNPLGDPSTRKLHVWLPPQYDQGTTRGRGRRFPVLFDLVGYTGSGPSHTGWRSFDENVPERAARLVAERKLGGCILVFPDCFTALGGNQYVNSSAMGRAGAPTGNAGSFHQSPPVGASIRSSCHETTTSKSRMRP